MDWKQVANEPWIWISGAILAGIALYQCTYFMIRALKIMKRCGLQRKDITSIIRGSVITSFGPVMSEIFIMIALVMALSAGFAWQREGAAVDRSLRSSFRRRMRRSAPGRSSAARTSI